MLIKEQIGEDTIVYIDAAANGTDLVYKVEKNGALVNGIADSRFEILNQKPTAQKNGGEDSEEDGGEGNGEKGETTPICTTTESDSE